MTRRAYLNERQRAYRWRSQVETALARLEELLAKRPISKYGELPEIPARILEHWNLVDKAGIDQSVQKIAIF